MTGAPVPWVPGSGVGRRPHRGRGPDALPANYLLLCVCITSSALVVRTLGLVHLPRTGSSDRGYLSRGSLAVSQVLGPVRFLCVEFATDRQKRGSIFLLIRLPQAQSTRHSSLRSSALSADPSRSAGSQTTREGKVRDYSVHGCLGQLRDVTTGLHVNTPLWALTWSDWPT